MMDGVGYFNNTPVALLDFRVLGGEPCVLVEWPHSGDREWLGQDEVYLSPKTTR